MSMRRFRVFFLLAGLALAATTLGCMQSVKEQTIEVKTPSDPMARVVPILQRYADGQPMGSEATSFPMLVKDVQKTDPAKGDILEKGLDGLQKAPPAARAGMAKQLLQKLQKNGS